jgi:dCMP deaminase
MSGKREDYISWEQYFMGIALLSAMRSNDPNTQVGCCIVDERRRVVAVGYSGFPTGCSDDDLPWERAGALLDTKYAYVCHAELNAILNRNAGELVGSTLYTTLFPCNECAKAIIQSGIREVVYLSDKYHDDERVVASRRMLTAAGIRFRAFEEALQISLAADQANGAHSSSGATRRTSC